MGLSVCNPIISRGSSILNVWRMKERFNKWLLPSQTTIPSLHIFKIIFEQATWHAGS